MFGSLLKFAFARRLEGTVIGVARMSGLDQRKNGWSVRWAAVVDDPNVCVAVRRIDTCAKRNSAAW